MSDDSNRPELLASVPSEGEAALIIAALERQGIQAYAEGGLTSALRTEVPTGVKIMVRHADLDRAAAALDALSSEGEEPD